jgi:hypothetical protein
MNYQSGMDYKMAGNQIGATAMLRGKQATVRPYLNAFNSKINRKTNTKKAFKNLHQANNRKYSILIDPCFWIPACSF